MVYYFNDGTPSEYPTSVELARKVRSKRYNAGTPCGHNGCRSKIRFTANDACIMCSDRRANNTYHAIIRDNKKVPLSPEQAHSMGMDYYYTPRMCTDKGHIGKKRLDGKCYTCWEEKKGNSVRNRALKAGAEKYNDESVCGVCGMTNQRWASNGRCCYCHPIDTGSTGDGEHSARRVALLAGAKWYIPEDPCPKCKLHALRYVANGRCKGCSSAPGVVTDHERILMLTAPGTVMARESAFRAGINVYRNKGDVWRFVTTTRPVV